jgi:hypothetical protein
MSHAYSEDQLVEQPAIGLFDDLGWETVSAAEKIFGTNPHPGPLTSSISASLRFPKGEGDRGLSGCG